MIFSRNILSLAFAFSTTVDAFWRMNCGIVQTGRVDPIISPGTVSSHVHKIAGGSNINIDSTYESMQNSSCTSCEIQADKSGYWTPQLYYEHANGNFEEVPNQGMTVYYLGRGVNRANIVPFPPGFKMVSGDPLARSYDNTTMTWGNASNPPEKLANRVTFNCLDQEGPLPQLPYMWRTNCSDGLRAQLQFQSCWDGVNLYKSDGSHVDYMSSIDNGACPPTHPVQLVHLFFEVLYGVNNVDQSDGGRFVFANGDTTGYGFHGDFLNGWDMSVLTPALANCANPDNDGQISACPWLAKSDINTFSEVCPQYAPSGLPIFNETTLGNIGNSLPGCITITSGPEEAPLSSIECPAGVDIPVTNPQPVQSPIVYKIPQIGASVGNPGWVFAGQYMDNGATRVLNGGTLQTHNMTIEVCQSYCFSQGLRFAGLEYGLQCWCSSQIPSWANTTNSINFLPCAANNSETCGGGAFLQVYNYTLSTATMAAPGAGPTPASAGTYYGCAQEGTSGRALSGASTTSASMTLEMCRAFCDSNGFFYSGVEYSQQCYCGNSFANGGMMLSNNASCTMLCGGSKAETCGGGNRLSVFNSTTLGLPNPPSQPPVIAEAGGFNNGSWNYAACVVDVAQNSPSRSLTGPSYADGSLMTLENCASFAQQWGQKFFGIEYASQCYTGMSIMGPVTADSQCSMTCNGNKLEFCGAGWRMSTYVNLAPGEAPPPLPSAAVSTSATTSTSTTSPTPSTTYVPPQPSTSSTTSTTSSSQPTTTPTKSTSIKPTTTKSSTRRSTTTKASTLKTSSSRLSSAIRHVSTKTSTAKTSSTPTAPVKAASTKTTSLMKAAAKTGTPIVSVSERTPKTTTTVKSVKTLYTKIKTRTSSTTDEVASTATAEVAEVKKTKKAAIAMEKMKRGETWFGEHVE